MSTKWSVYSLLGKDAYAKTVPAGDRSAVKWFVRWRVNGGTVRKRTFHQKGHGATFHEKLIAAKVNDSPADGRGWPVSSDAPVVPEEPTTQGLTFEDYCNNIWYPNHRAGFDPKNRRGHRDNMRDAIAWLRYSDNDYRVCGTAGQQPGASVLLKDVVADDVHAALAVRARTNKTITAVNQRRIEAAFAAGETNLELKPETASPRTVRAFYVTLAMILNAAKRSGHLTGDPLEGTARSAPKPRTTSMSQRIVPSIDEVFDLADAIAQLGPLMADGRPAGERFRSLVLCGGSLAPRPGELTGHRPAWIDWDDPVVMRFHKTEGPIYDPEENIRGHQIRTLKHRAEDEFRSVPVLAEVAEALRLHIERGYASPERTWSGLKGAPLTWGNLMDVYWRPACLKVFGGSDKPELVTMTPSRLRKSAITFWLDSGIQPYQAAEWAGHSEDVSKRYYAGTASLTFRRQAALLAKNYEAVVSDLSERAS